MILYRVQLQTKIWSQLLMNTNKGNSSLEQRNYLMASTYFSDTLRILNMPESIEKLMENKDKYRSSNWVI